MTRKRFIKLAMSEGMNKNEAIFAAKCCLDKYKNYKIAYEKLYGHIRFRFKTYMPGYDKIQKKRIAKQY